MKSAGGGAGLGTRAMFGWMGNFWARRMAVALLAVSVAGQVLIAPRGAEAANDVVHITSAKNASIKLAKGKPKTVKTDVPFYEIVIGDPEIANVNPLTDRSFYVLGNNLGTTGVALFDENKQLVGTMDIEVTLDTDRLANTIRDSVPGRGHPGQLRQRPCRAVGLGQRSGRRRQGVEDCQQLLRPGGGDQLGQHLVFAAGAAQRPLRRDQSPGRAGARHQDRRQISRP